MTGDIHSKAALYAAKEGEYYRTVNPLVVSLLQPGEVLFEVGCAGGLLGKYVREKGMFRETYGIELDPAAAAAAAPLYTKVYNGDLESFDLSLIPEMDAVVCADVLEHLVDPWDIFARLIAKIRPGGYLILSIPNARHVRVWGRLVFQGRFDYTESGVMDRGHLRFFAFQNLMEMFDQHKLDVEVVNRRTAPRGKLFTILSLGVLRDLFTYQFVFRLRK